MTDDHQVNRTNSNLNTKTFGLKTPTDLHTKLIYDIERLRSTRSTVEARYAAFDCAVDAWHLVDWTLHMVDNSSFERLTGRERPGNRTKRDRRTVETCFADMQEVQLPALEVCHLLANSVKHRQIRSDPEPETSSNTTAFLAWQHSDEGERSLKSYRVFTYICHRGEKLDAVSFFAEMADQWAAFLQQEGLFHPFPDFPEDE